MTGRGPILANGPNSLIYWHWVGTHTHEIGVAVTTHLRLASVAVAIGIVISIPLALVARRYRPARALILGVTGTFYTIPALALFFLLGPLTGYTTVTTAEIALVSYTLLILVRNTVTGLEGVPPEVAEAARGMGYTRLRLLTRVELPLALPGIFAGIRVATVTTIGLVTVAALIGQGGLGQMIITDGFQRGFTTPVVVGAVLCVALALVADAVLLGVQWLLTPWTHGRRGVR